MGTSRSDPAGRPARAASAGRMGSPQSAPWRPPGRLHRGFESYRSYFVLRRWRHVFLCLVRGGDRRGNRHDVGDQRRTAAQADNRAQRGADDAANPAGLGNALALPVHLVAAHLVEVFVAHYPGEDAHGQCADQAGQSVEDGAEAADDDAQDAEHENEHAAVRFGVATNAMGWRAIVIIVIAADWLAT